jgi:hypothetical protein
MNEWMNEWKGNTLIENQCISYEMINTQKYCEHLYAYIYILIQTY